MEGGIREAAGTSLTAEEAENISSEIVQTFEDVLIRRKSGFCVPVFVLLLTSRQ